MARRSQRAKVMKQSDSQQILKLLTRLTEELVGSVKTRPRAKRKEPLSDRVDRLDRKIGTSRSKRPLASQVDSLTDKVENLGTKVTGLDARIGTSRRNLPIAVQLDALDTKVDKRFDVVDRCIDATREHVVDLVTRVHEEITKRVVDLEVPASGPKGNGGKGSGGSGVPLAS
jgi:hypothetical protein